MGRRFRAALFALALMVVGCQAPLFSVRRPTSPPKTDGLNATVHLPAPTAPIGWTLHQRKCLSLSAPDEWRLDRADEYSLGFVAPDRTYVSVALINCACSLATEPADDILSCLMGYAARIQAKSESWVYVISADTWKDTDWRGYLTEYNLRGSDHVDQYQGWLFLPVDDGRAVVACLTKVGERDVSDEQWRGFLGVAETVRLACK